MNHFRFSFGKTTHYLLHLHKFRDATLLGSFSLSQRIIVNFWYLLCNFLFLVANGSCYNMKNTLL